MSYTRWENRKALEKVGMCGESHNVLVSTISHACPKDLHMYDIAKVQLCNRIQFQFCNVTLDIDSVTLQTNTCLERLVCLDAI